MKQLVLLLGCIQAVLTGASYADSNPFEGFEVEFSQEQTEASQSASSSSGLAGGIFNSVRADESKVTENPEMQGNGREYKADDAAKQGQTGMAAAIATGAVLVAKGTQMMMSPIIPVKIAGAELVAKGAMEFAQAGADAQANTANKAQNRLLTNEAAQSGKQQTPSKSDVEKQIAEQLQTPEFNQFAGQAGMNSEALAQQLASGQLLDPGEILKIGGINTGDFSSEDFAAGSKLAGSELAAELNKVDNSRLVDNTASQMVVGGAGGSSMFASSPVATTSDSTLGNPERHLPGKAGGARRGLASTGAGGEGGAGEGSPGIAGNNLMNNIFGALGFGGASADGMGSMTRSALLQLGIHTPMKGQSVFTLANRTYRSFGKWRKTKKLTASR